MGHRFNPSRIKRIAIGCEYDVVEADGSQIVVEAPSGWSVRRRPLSRTLRIEPSATSCGGHQIASGNVVGGSIVQVSNVRGDLSIGDPRSKMDNATPKVVIYLPSGCCPDIVSL